MKAAPGFTSMYTTGIRRWHFCSTCFHLLCVTDKNPAAWINILATVAVLVRLTEMCAFLYLGHVNVFVAAKACKISLSLSFSLPLLVQSLAAAPGSQLKL